MASAGNHLKALLRKTIKTKLKSMPVDLIKSQSKEITQKILSSDVFKKSQRISIYLSMTTGEVCTIEILEEMFRQGKQVYIPTYEGNLMEMVRLKDMTDYESLELTKWNIKQPNMNENRENALATGDGLDLFLMPGVAFTINGGRCGHGMGYYDKYLQRHFQKFPHRLDTTKKLNLVEKFEKHQTVLIGLAFREQIVNINELPLDEHDLLLDWIATVDDGSYLSKKL